MEPASVAPGVSVVGMMRAIAAAMVARWCGSKKLLIGLVSFLAVLVRVPSTGAVGRDWCDEVKDLRGSLPSFRCAPTRRQLP